MAGFLRRVYWDLSRHTGRYHYFAYLIRDLPGFVGRHMRRKWYSHRFETCGVNLRIHPGVVILNPERVRCGNDVHIGVGSYIQAGGSIEIGSDVLLGPYVKIWSQNHVFKDPDRPVREQGYVHTPVRIGDDVWVGADAFLMPGASLGAKCVVSAASVVGAKDYPAGSILAGNPARKIGDRIPRGVLNDDSELNATHRGG